MKNKLYILSVVSIMTALSVTSVFANEVDYAIKKYDVNLNFNKNNLINTSETIQAGFTNSRDGISRFLNLNYVKNDKILTRTIRDVETSDIHVLKKTENTEIIKIADAKQRIGEQKEYVFTYNSQYSGNIYSKDFSYDLIDGTWNRTVENLNFKLVFPKKLKYKRIEFVSSVSGIIDESLVEYSIHNNMIEGHYIGKLLPNETFSIHIMTDKKSLNNVKNNQLILNNVRHQKISVYEGDEIIVKLKSNPTTGFIWQLAVESDNEGIINLSDSQFIPPNKDICGAPGITEYKIKALNPGKAIVNGVYVRPWLKNEDTSKTSIEYEIEVMPLKN